MNFTNANLSKLDLRYINFKYAVLKNANLSGANLSYCNFERADLCHAVLDVSSCISKRGFFLLFCRNLQNHSILIVCNYFVEFWGFFLLNKLFKFPNILTLPFFVRIWLSCKKPLFIWNLNYCFDDNCSHIHSNRKFYIPVIQLQKEKQPKHLVR